MARVLICDKLADDGGEILQRNGIDVDDRAGISAGKLKEIIAGYDGVIVRSRTKLTGEVIDLAGALKVIGRAGTGVDNIDLEAATKKGVLVVNAPESNIHSTAELTFSMLLALSRNIPQACASVKTQKWEKKRFGGVEITGKTLGVLGFGRIGSHVAEYARGFSMEVLVYDPYVSEDSVQEVGAKSVDLDTLLAGSDYITVHTPLTPETRGMLGAGAFSKMKDGVRIINCARGGIVDEQALLEALETGKVAGAALDVFEKEPPAGNSLLMNENVIATPHLGASTTEAQKNVAAEIAERIVAYFKNNNMEGAVNLPHIDQATMLNLLPYMTLCEKLGSFLAQMMTGRIKNIAVDYSGKIGTYDIMPLTRCILKGFLGAICEESINLVNAHVKARQRGIKVTESKSTDVADFAELVQVSLKTDQQEVSIAGTIFGARKDPRIVRVNGYHVDAIPSGALIIIHNWDRAGLIGKVGTVLGKHGINIADMALGRDKELDKAVVLINIDGDIDAAALKDLNKIKEIIEVRVVYL